MPRKPCKSRENCMSKGTLSCKHESAFYFSWKEKSRAFCSAHDNAEDGTKTYKPRFIGISEVLTNILTNSFSKSQL